MAWWSLRSQRNLCRKPGFRFLRSYGTLIKLTHSLHSRSSLVKPGKLGTIRESREHCPPVPFLPKADDWRLGEECL